MSLNNEFVHVSDDEKFDAEILVKDLNMALNAVVTSVGMVDVNDRVKIFAQLLDKGEVPTFDNSEIQELAYVWAGQNRGTILGLRKQYKWFLQ